MQRLIIAYNPRSTKHALIEREVVRPANKLLGVMVGKFEVKHVSVEENAERLARILLDGDLVVAAGGDGTGTMALNAIMLSKKDVTLGVLGYGNFNDFSRMLGYKNIEEIVGDFSKHPGKYVQTLYPLEALVDGKHYRYSACYLTVGMFAESTELFDQKKTRGTLKTGKKGIFYSMKELAKWYFGNKWRKFLPDETKVDGKRVNKIELARSGKRSVVKGAGASDLLFVNGPTVAKMMRGGEWWKKPREFTVSVGRLTGFFRLVKFMMRSMMKGVPGKTVGLSEDSEGSRGSEGSRARGLTDEVSVRVEFPAGTEVEIQGEGEYKKIAATELVIRKSGRGVKVVGK